MLRKTSILGSFLAICILCLCSCRGINQEIIDGFEQADRDGQINDMPYITWYYGTNVSKNMITSIAEEYYSQTGIAVRWISTEDISLKGAFASGEAPDVFVLNALTIQDWAPRTRDLSGQTWTGGVFESSLDAATVDGKLCAMPLTYEACGIVYNKELFQKADISKLPQTIDELEQACIKLEQSGIQPFAESYQLSGFAGHTMAIAYAYEEDRQGFYEQMINNEKTVADLTYYQQWLRLFDLLSDYGCGSDAVYYSVDDQIADFADGKFAMLKQGTWMEPLILGQNPDIPIGLMAVPLTDREDDCKLMTATTNFLAVNADTKKLDMALDFLDWLYDHAQEYLVEAGGMSVCYYNLDKDSLGALNADAWEYEREGKIFSGFGSEQWPDGYSEDVQKLFHQYLQGILPKEKIAGELTMAFLLRYGQQYSIK